MGSRNRIGPCNSLRSYVGVRITNINITKSLPPPPPRWQVHFISRRISLPRVSRKKERKKKEKKGGKKESKAYGRNRRIWGGEGWI